MNISCKFTGYLEENKDGRIAQELKINPLLIPYAEEVFNESGTLWQEPKALYEDLIYRALVRTKKDGDTRSAILDILKKSAFALCDGVSFELSSIIRNQLDGFNITHFRQDFGILPSHPDAPTIFRDIIFETRILNPWGFDPMLFDYLAGAGMYDFVQNAHFDTTEDFQTFLRTQIISRAGHAHWHKPLRHFAPFLSRGLFDDLLSAFLHPLSDTRKSTLKLIALDTLIRNVSTLQMKKTQQLLLTEQDAGPEWQEFVLDTLRKIGNPFLISRENTLQTFIDAGRAEERIISKARDILEWATDQKRS
ncbi:MAG: hypothetical protein HGB18_04595 [Candidatus Moranbacteria bacterium]|nr:hypothetical protein [Candidatus Moranbacteria bacterium]